MTSFGEIFRQWIGWGWAAAFVVWAAGSALILTSVQRYFLERTGSRRMTIVIFIIWSLVVIGAAARWFGFGAPAAA